MALMWLMSWRDLTWRKRRFAIAICGTALTFAVTLVLTGVVEGIDLEAERTIDSLGADAFIVSANAPGPFTSLAQVPSDAAAPIARLPGVEEAAAIVSVRHTISSQPETDVYLIGAEPGRVGMAVPGEGRAPRARGEAAIGSASGRSVGDVVAVGDMTFEVVGVLRETSVWLNVPVMFVTLPDAQRLVFAGSRAATAILTRGAPARLPESLDAQTPDEALSDLKRPLRTAITNIVLIQVLLWAVAAAIVGSLLYISALERSRDFAVFKAFGTRSVDLAGSLVLEALAMAAAAGLAAVALSRPLGSMFPAVISYPAWTAVLLVAIAAATGVLGALAGARRAIAVDPAQAFSSR